jgi:hypothetical protein
VPPPPDAGVSARDAGAGPSDAGALADSGPGVDAGDRARHRPSGGGCAIAAARDLSSAESAALIGVLFLAYRRRSRKPAASPI